MIKRDVLMAIHQYGPVTIPSLCRVTSYSELQVRNAIKVLTREGEVRRIGNMRHPVRGRRNPFSLYAVTWPEPQPAERPGSIQPMRPAQAMATPRSPIRRLWRRIVRAINRPLEI